jgi:hypothetical protein
MLIRKVDCVVLEKNVLAAKSSAQPSHNVTLSPPTSQRASSLALVTSSLSRQNSNVQGEN